MEFLKGDLIIDEYWHIFHMKGKIAVEDQVLKQKGWRGTAIQVDYQGNMIPLESGYAFCLLPLPDRTSKRLLRATTARINIYVKLIHLSGIK